MASQPTPQPAPKQAAPDPVVVDPKHYTVEIENEKVRVLRITYGAHEKSVMHGHPSSVAVFLTDANFRFTLHSGSRLKTPLKLKRP